MVTLCGQCGKEKCECAPLATTTRRVPMPESHPNAQLVTSPIVLPDLLECAVFGQQMRKDNKSKHRDK